MSNNFAIIGGDLRTIKLAQKLAEDGNEAYTYGLEQAEDLKNMPNIYFAESLKEAIQFADIAIGPIPFSK